MLFTSITYLIFFPLVLACYWFSPLSWRRPLLLIASYVFYMNWLPQYGVLLFLLTVLNYGLGLGIAGNTAGSKARHSLLVLGLVLNLGTLCFYKYTNFLLNSLNSVLSLNLFKNLGANAHFAEANIILPLGISFFAFEFIHYLTDVFKGGKPIRSIIDFGLFAAFFPSQIAGPIKRYQDFVKQLESLRSFSWLNFNQGLTLILQGLFKKIALSDNLAVLAQAGFSNATTIGASDAWLSALAFTWQIYFDFSGYTDIGRGSALMLGFSLPDNFNFPYIAKNLSDFWKRWHISLSSWLRDYLYIPLGGGRVSRLRKHANLMITMLLGGLWHGAAWHYVIWGAVHGAGLVVSHEYDELVKRSQLLTAWHKNRLVAGISMLATFAVVVMAWIFFRADNLAQALQLIAALFSAKPSHTVTTLLYQSTLPVSGLLYGIYALLYSRPWQDINTPNQIKVFMLSDILQKPSFKLAASLGIFLCSIGFAPPHAEPFIYFQF